MSSSSSLYIIYRFGVDADSYEGGRVEVFVSRWKWELILDCGEE